MDKQIQTDRLHSWSSSQDIVNTNAITFKSFLFFLILYVLVFCFQVCLHTTYVQCLWRTEEGDGSYRTVVTDGYMLQHVTTVMTSQ